MHILGISCYYHDAAAALLSDGVLVAAAEEERFSRKKHDPEFPVRAIRFCLDTAGITAADLDYVVFYEKPFVKFERILLSCLHGFPRSWRLFREAMITWHLEKLWIRALICERLGVNTQRVLFSEHHLSHAASAFFCSPFPEAAILTIDGVGEWTTASMALGKAAEIRIFKEMRFPHSLGMLYSVFTAFLGFEVNEGEYKVMGMAPYGQPRYLDKVNRLLRLFDDGSFWLDMDYFSYHYSPDRAFNSKFVALWGAPRDPDVPFFTESTGFPAYFGEPPSNVHDLAKSNQRYADIAASIQAVTEEVILKMARALHRETGQRRLCLAGGVALNSVANGRLLREGPFEEIFIHPAAGDGGGAVGAALFVHHCLLRKPRAFVMEHGYWGQAHSAARIRQSLEQAGIRYRETANEDELVAHAVQLLQAGKVVGWLQGRFEWGPRALGNRSILADPRRSDMKDIVNTKIKFREPYRPFAPSVLVERAAEYFDLPDPAKHYPARFMLLVADVKKPKRNAIPATTHVDGTGRLQTVHRDLNPLYYHLIKRFGEATGIPVLLNTSFNLKGEPIVNSAEEALSTFMRSGMDALVLGPFVVEKG
jgi:carbamoyltransferase